jgi:hypothetical protein
VPSGDIPDGVPWAPRRSAWQLSQVEVDDARQDRADHFDILSRGDRRPDRDESGDHRTPQTPRWRRPPDRCVVGCA